MLCLRKGLSLSLAEALEKINRGCLQHRSCYAIVFRAIAEDEAPRRRGAFFVTTPQNAYGDGRVWDEAQIARVNDLLNLLRDNLDVNDLGSLRKNTLWLMDVVFPTGFSYQVNTGPSEDVHGGYMEGQVHA